MFLEGGNNFPVKPVRGRKAKIFEAACAACKFTLIKEFHAASPLPSPYSPHTMLKSSRQSLGKTREDVCQV